jgi:hypothetical protein
VKLLHWIVFWLLFSFGALAQVAAPDIRCLSVGVSGNVTITWIKPADPGTQFTEYEIYHSISAAGPFSTIAALPVYNLTSYTHVGPNANTQSQYYFMRTKFGANSFSPNSDTLRSLHIVVSVSSNSIATVNYNLLATPSLSSTASTYTVFRQKGASAFNTIRITGSRTLNDTAFRCLKDKYNYQVSIADNSGCVSQSSIVGDSLFGKPAIQKIDTWAGASWLVAFHFARLQWLYDLSTYQRNKNTNCLCAGYQ